MKHLKLSRYHDGTSVKPGFGSFGGGFYVADWKVMQGQEGKALEKPSSLYTCFVCVWFVMACIMGCLLLVGCAHLVIDIWKSYREDNVVWFALDQMMHLLVIAGVAYAWTGCHDWNLPFGIELRHVVIAVALLICWKPANIFIKLMLKERWLILIFVCLQRYEALGLLIAAKSIIRFGDKETAKTEYVLAGTLLSILIAVLAGMMVIGVLKP